ncbi:ABC transporter ATP-binding protein, partial [Aliarcobacter butzleri]
MRNSDIIIDIANLSYSYNSERIYENLDLQTKDGTIFGLLGKKGVGRSAFITILVGFLQPNS